MLSPRLLTLLDVASVAAVDEACLRGLAEGHVAEDQDLEFHSARYNYGPDGTFELAKDVAALANHVGGLIILGVAEDDQGRAARLTPVKLADSEKGRIRRKII